MSLKVNVFYGTLLNLFNMSYPFLTGAYLSRVLGVSYLGQINYVQAIVAFLLVLSYAGTSIYGVRGVARVKGDKEQLSRFVSELFCLKSLTTISIAFCYYSSLIFLKEDADFLLFFIVGLSIIVSIIDMDWFLAGTNNYRIIFLWSICVKMVAFGFMLFYIKAPDDYLIYVSILVFVNIFGFSAGFIYTLNFVKLSFRGLNLSTHLKKIRAFFAHNVITNSYMLFSSILLGSLGGVVSLALFVRSRNFQSVGNSIASSFYNTMVASLSEAHSDNKVLYHILLEKSFDYMCLIAFPIAVGLFCLSVPLNILVGGEQFIDAYRSLLIIAPAILFYSYNNLIYLNVFIPANLEYKAIKIQSFVTGSSILFSLFLIPIFKDVGAAIGILIPEILGSVMITLEARRTEKLNLIRASFFKYMISSFIMGAFVYIMSIYFVGSLNTFWIVGAGASFYFTLLFIFRDRNVNEIAKYVLYIVFKVFQK